MRACVIFATRFGNTEKIARAIQSGIQELGIQTECLGVENVRVDSLGDYDLISVGAPTEAFSASKPMKDFLSRLKGLDLSGRAGFAFDTKLDWRISGSAAKFIEKELRNRGLRLLAPRESALVSVIRTAGEITGATLKEGEVERFVQIGRRIGAALEADPKEVPA